MGTIIALQGDPDKGKTATLSLVFKQMSNNGYKVLKKRQMKGKPDIYAILEKNKKKIGLSTAGDVTRFVRSRLDWFEEESCKIIVIACNNVRGIINAVESRKAFQVEYIPKTYAEEKSAQQNVNEKDARTIFERVEELVKLKVAKKL